jgi:preprotein translocase subunit SecE
VARTNRRGRDISDDGVDEPIDDEFDDLDDSDAEEFDDADEFEDEFDDEEEEKPARGTRVGTATRTRAVGRTKTDAAPGILGRIVRRVRETVAELQKVIWPTRKELLTYTTVVVVFVALIMTIVALLDAGFAKLMFAVFGKNQ